MAVTYLEKNQVPAHLRGSYTGNKFQAHIVESVTIHADAGTWSGGSRDVYFAIDLSDGRSVSITDTFTAPWDSERRDREINLVPGFAIVRRSTFAGKAMGLAFYIHPNSAAKLLPAPTDPVSPHGRIVLIATASYKSSYNGMNRYDMARKDATYSWNQQKFIAKFGVFPTPEQWEAAKAELIAAKLLNKAGAITPAGRNAVADDRF